MENESWRSTPLQKKGLLKNSILSRFSVQTRLQWLQIGSKSRNCDVPRAKEPVSSFVASFPSRGRSFLRTICASFFFFASKNRSAFFSPKKQALNTQHQACSVYRGTGPVANLKLHPMAATITLDFGKLLRASKWPGPAIQRCLGSSSGQRGQGWVDQWRWGKQLKPANDHVGQVQII